MKRVFMLAVLLLVVQSALAAEGSEDQEIRIGLILPLTGSTAVWGIDARRSAEILERTLSEDSPRTYRFLIEDGNCGKGNAATTAAQKLINIDKVHFLTVACSGEMLQVGPIAQRAGIPVSCFACSHPDVKHIGDFAFRTYLDIEKGVRLVAEEIRRRIDGPIAVLTEENSFTVGIKELLEKELGDKIAYSAEFAPETGDYKTILLKVRAAHPAAYFLNPASPATYVRLVQQMKQLGMDAPLYAYHMPGDRSSIEALGEAQNGARFFEVPDIETASDDFIALREEFLAKHPEGIQMEFLMRSGYDAMVNYAKAVSVVGSNRRRVRDFLASERMAGALGTIQFDEFGDIRGLEFVMKEIVDGQPVVRKAE